MSAKTLLRIAIALGVLLVAWASLALMRRASQDRPPRIVLPLIRESQADRIVMARPTDTVVVAKGQNGTWQTEGAPVSPQAIEDFFAALADSTAPSELVAESAASHERMGVDSAKAKRLTVSGGGTVLLELWLGNRGPDFEGYYVRRPNEDAVYLYHGRLPALADQRVADWRDKVIARLAPDSIAAIEVVRGRQTWRVKREGAGWVLSGGARPDSAALARYLQLFREIRATGFPDRAQADSARFDRPDRALTVFGPGGARLLALVFDSTWAGFWVRARDGGPLYTLDRERADALLPDEQRLRGGTR